LLVGTTSPFSATTDVFLASRDQAATTKIVVNNQTNNASAAAALSIEAYGGGATFSVPSSTPGTNPLVITVGGAERARITYDGNFYVGGSTLSSSFSTYAGARQYIYTSALIQMRDPTNTAGLTWQCGPEANAGGSFVVYNASSAGVYLGYGNTSWTANSDERVKDIIEPITDAINKVSTIRAVIGKYKIDEEGTRRSFLIAQDVQAVLPEAVTVKDDELGTLGVQYTEVIPLLVAAIKEQQALIENLTTRLAALEAK
jgi:hypothetical protein